MAAHVAGGVAEFDESHAVRVEGSAELDEDLAVWVGLWGWRHRGATVPCPAPVPGWADPWPSGRAPSSEGLVVPAKFGSGWVAGGGGSSRSGVFLREDLVLRLAVPGEAAVEVETVVLAAVSHPLVAEVLDAGDGWLLTRRLPGCRPAGPGPWVAELGVVAAELAVVGPPLGSEGPVDVAGVVRACGAEVAGELEVLAGAAVGPGFSHGDLHAGNVLVDAAGHLSGVVDFEKACGAPLERDLAVWVCVLAPQVGVAAVRDAARAAAPAGADRQVLAGMVARHVVACVGAAQRHGGGPRFDTARFLAAALVADPDLPYRVLFA